MLRYAIAALFIGIGAIGGCSDEGEATAQYRLLAGDPNYVAPRDRAAAAADAQATSAPADIVLTPTSDLGTYLAYAAQNNPGLQAAFHRWKASLDRIPQERALPDPRFSYRYFVVGQAMRDGDLRNVFEISQEFPWLTKLLLRGDAAAQEARAQQQRFEAQRLKLFNQVAAAYWEYYYIHRAAAIAQENAQQIDAIEGIARARYSAASGSQPDLLRVQVEQGKVQDELRSTQDQMGPLAAKLNAALGRPVDSELPSPSPAAEANVNVDDKQLVSWMLDHSPELRALDFDIARQRKGIDLARQDYFPDIMLGMEFDQMASASGVDSGDSKNPYALLVSMNVPIWWDKYAAGVREAREKHWAAVKDKAQKANDLGVDLKLAAYGYRNAQRKAALYRDTLLPRARQSLSSYRAGYQSGGAIFSDVLDAQRIVLEFQLAYERAYADRQKALAEMEMIVGTTLPRGGPASAPAAAAEPAAGGQGESHE